MFLYIWTTYTRLSVAFFNLRRLARASSAISFNDQFGSGVSSCSRSTFRRACPHHPMIPFAMDGLILSKYIFSYLPLDQSHRENKIVLIQFYTDIFYLGIAGCCNLQYSFHAASKQFVHIHCSIRSHHELLQSALLDLLLEFRYRKS